MTRSPSGRAERDDGRQRRGQAPRVAVRCGNMLAGALAGSRGFDPARLAEDGDLAGRFRGAFSAVEARRAAGDMGFFDLPFDGEAAVRVSDAARAVERFDALVVIGIGGSAVGAKAVRDALLPPFWNERAPTARAGRPRLYVLDNPDPATVLALLGRLDLRNTAVNVVSKSGTTAETTANFMVVWDRLRRALDEGPARGPASAEGPASPSAGLRHGSSRDAARRLVVTTGSAGPLRRLAEDLGAVCLPVPGNVGGRFSVLSAAGLLPAAAVGLDVDALLGGAGEMARRCATPVLRDNPAGLVATLLHAAHVETGAWGHVLMPYGDRLRGLGAWFRQLWAESLGKSRDLTGATVDAGPTPLSALGAQDQHSLLQLLMEGPMDKAVVFVACRSPGEDVAAPAVFPPEFGTAYLEGRGLFELLDAERRATADALRRAGRMNMTVSLDVLDARSLGALFMLFQVAVVYAGALYGVDPLGQPGVELGKKLARELLADGDASG